MSRIEPEVVSLPQAGMHRAGCRTLSRVLLATVVTSGAGTPRRPIDSEVYFFRTLQRAHRYLHRAFHARRLARKAHRAPITWADPFKRMAHASIRGEAPLVDAEGKDGRPFTAAEPPASRGRASLCRPNGGPEFRPGELRRSRFHVLGGGVADGGLWSARLGHRLPRHRDYGRRRCGRRGGRRQSRLRRDGDLGPRRLRGLDSAWRGGGGQQCNKNIQYKHGKIKTW